ncbi:hypothetical protein BN946_scf184835.g4 [Trametes cinnabarina]|uniref:XLF-like N-terminal domain-containing protein n=1 Tax=Pycnoporus cinnabarinus TaxID=5643 RepID=A0A060SS78_PYCCI|nr:hypothetical protein BN946_scf184835.g4 [Trametes cinnabarina]
MEYLSEEHDNLLLAKEWLVKVDSDTSTPYLLKFYASTADLKCCIMLTDTRSVWGEDLTFEIVHSKYSDLAFDIRNNTFRWRWETLNVGPKLAPTIISKHLIMPLISMTHLSFFSTEPLGSTSETDLEKSADRLGRIARRTVDTHVKNTLSKPIVATTLRRMGAVLNFVPDPPRIVIDAPTLDLRPPRPPAPLPPASAPPLHRDVSPLLLENSSAKGSQKKATAQRVPSLPPLDSDSVTEEEPSEVDEPAPSSRQSKGAEKRGLQEVQGKSNSPARSTPPRRDIPEPSVPSTSRDSPKRSSPDSSARPSRPKKTKRASKAGSSSDQDSEDEQSNRTAQAKKNARRGVKQPIKRPGRRF